MKLESVELQEPAEEWMYRKSEPPYQIGDEAYPLPFVGTWGNLRLLPTFVGGQPGSNRNHKGRREISPPLGASPARCAEQSISSNLLAKGWEREKRSRVNGP